MHFGLKIMQDGRFGKMILRAKTKELLQTRQLTQNQIDNSQINIQEIDNIQLELISYPRRIVLEMTSACNINCIMCGRDSNNKFVNTYLDISILDSLKDVLPHVEEVTLFGWGEPTIHPRFKNFLAILGEYNVRKYFVTNGMLLHKLVDAIIEYKVDIIAISLDGATAKTNNAIRMGSDFNQIIGNIQKIQLIKKTMNLSYPYMNFVFTAMQSNIKELPQMITLAHELGMDEVKVVYLTVFDKFLENETLFDAQDIVKEYFEKSIELAKRLQIKIKLPHYQGEDIARANSHKPCYTAWRDLFIGSDGTIRPCQSTSLKLASYKTGFSFLEIWNCEAFKNFRAIVNNEEKMPIQCSLCYQSSHANWNNKTAFLQIGTDFAPQWSKA